MPKMNEFLLLFSALLALPVVLAAPPIGPVLLLPLYSQPSIALPTSTAAPLFEPALLLQPQNETAVGSEKWPSTPFTKKISDDIYITIEEVGPLVLPVSQKRFFNSLTVIYFWTTKDGHLTDQINLPYYRRNRRVSVFFDRGLVNALQRWQLLEVLHVIQTLLLDCGPREIFWSKILIGKIPVATFSLTLRG